METSESRSVVARADASPRNEAPRLGQLVVVQGEWNGWRTAVVRASDLDSPHWSQPAGAPRPLLHAYVPCGSIVSGEIQHQCGPAPHRLHVCVLKKHTAPALFEALARIANAETANASFIPGDMPAVLR